MPYNHPITGKKIYNGFNSHEEICFYDGVTKKQMFLIIEQFATLLKNDNQTWCQKALEELNLLKMNGITK